MGPGPSDVYPEVLAAMSRPTIGHLDPAFVEFMDELNQLLRYAFQTQNTVTMPISAPGSAGMECCFVNLLEPGEKVVIASNGVFGGRMLENARRCGANPVVVEFEWGTPVDPGKVEDALKANPDAVALAFVHSETSTGVRSDAEALCKLAQQNDCLSIVDAVTTLGGIELKVDDWGIDAIYSGTQKCLSVPPGLSPVSFNDAAMDKVKSRSTPSQSWFLDLDLLTGYWGPGAKRAYHHTAPINSLYALDEGLRLLKKEGLENAWNRHAANHVKLREGLEAMGLEFYVDAEYRLPQLNAVKVPEGVDEAAVRSFLLNEFNLEIGAGLGPLAGKIWRIGLMGASSSEKHVELCLHGLKAALA
ncbi:MAG: alanine--glyoxylate aminotransferase family protein [Gammaproteobacteria bacterium]|nr:alanine--glyoxylate aminotransferase family protein [Gammaproteobacteria bacterium]MBT8075204.1 alanine--glyoxylate aminotransferase family protein [Gammaproteobacteria bacterium]NNL00270.1 alanine--glyoxylate aminotransferase family protein [Xanthomonadales bacterium]